MKYNKKEIMSKAWAMVKTIGVSISVALKSAWALAKAMKVDTEKYRYIAKDCGDHLEIRRIELVKLDTTDAIDGWELVEVIR